MNFNREELEMLQDDSGGTFGSAYVKQLAADLLEARARDVSAILSDYTIANQSRFTVDDCRALGAVQAILVRETVREENEMAAEFLDQ